MITAIINIVLLIVGFLVGLFVNSQIWLPVVYGLPKAIYFVIKGELKFMAIPYQLITPIIWIFILVAFGFITYFISPELNKFFTDNSALNGGFTLSIGALIWNFLTVNGRATMKAEWDANTYKKFKK